MADIDKNVFVSHIHEDDAEVRKLKDLLAKQGFNIRDYSVTKDNPNNAHNEDYIKQQILKPRLDASDTLAVIIEPITKSNKRVELQVRYAIEHGKRIVGIWANGSTSVEVPHHLKDVCHSVVSWDLDRIVNALNGDNSIQQDSQGEPFPYRKIPTAKCP